MNILFTNFCNRSCPYCFAKGKLILEKPSSCEYIKLKDLKTIVNFLKRSKVGKVGILGGEPTLHPEFKKAVTILIKAGLYLDIFTNGLMKRDIVLFLKGLDPKKYRVLLNINSPKSYSKREWSILNRTARLLGNTQLSLSFNIYQLEFNMDFTIDFIQRYHLVKRIRVGLATPIFGSNNKYVEITEYPKIGNKILDFVEKIRGTGILLVFDCGFTLCSFTDEQLGRLFRFGTHLFFHCESVIDVGPDLSVWSCFATSQIWNRKLTDFTDLNAVIDFYQEKFSGFHRVGSRSSCLRCEHLRLGNCSGGCLGHTLKEFHLENRLKELL